MKRATWVIAQYRKSLSDFSKNLLPFIEAELKVTGQWDKVELLVVLYEDKEQRAKAFERLKFLAPSLVHFHFESIAKDAGESPFHEDENWISKLKKEMPQTRFLGTHHLVIRTDPRNNLSGFTKGVLKLFGLHSNTIKLQPAWKNFDHVSVESKLQMVQFKSAGYEKITTISYPVFSFGKQTEAEPKRGVVSVAPDDKVIVHFGFFSNEMAQDITVEALKHLPSDVKLVLAGGARRTTDHPFLDYCLNLARTLGVRDRLHVTGLLDDRFLVDVFHRADLIVAPFRKSAGILHLGKVFAQGCPLVASDLEVHRELLDSYPNSMLTFAEHSPVELAKAIGLIIQDPLERARLRSGSLGLADELSSQNIAKSYVSLYESLT